MKKAIIQTTILIFSLGLSLLFFSCNTPANSGKNESTSDDSKQEIPAPIDNGISSRTPPSVNATLAEDFIRGFDASMVSALEENGVKYYTEKGNEIDIFELLKNNGVNWIRLRLWVNPSNYAGNTLADGDNTTVRTIAVAKRVKAAGLKLLLDFHYSDTWTDPGLQTVPKDWENITTQSEMASKIKEYTKSTLQQFKDADCLPDMVQLGNEINAGILLHTSSSKKGNLNDSNPDVRACSWTGSDYTSQNENLVAYLKAASEAVSEVSSSIKRMIHVAEGGAVSGHKWFFDKLTTVDYEVIGLSYYPFFKSHGPIYTQKSQTGENTYSLYKNVEFLKQTYKKEVVIAETSFAWSDGYNDSTTNQLWYYDSKTEPACGLACAYKNLLYSDETALPQGITTKKKDGLTCIAPTVDNQVNVLKEIIQASALAGAKGFFYWGGDSVSGKTFGSTMENQTFFDFNNCALDSIAVFNVQGE